MEEEKRAIFISLSGVIIFLIVGILAYINVNKKIGNLNVVMPIVIFSAENLNAGMDININDMLTAESKEIASSTSFINVSYENILNEYQFKMIMHNLSSYDKTIGVDGIKTHEYTYEIGDENGVIIAEKEIASFAADTKVELAKLHLPKGSGNKRYYITFRFYSNEYDQSHLAGSNLNGNVYIETSL